MGKFFKVISIFTICLFCFLMVVLVVLNQYLKRDSIEADPAPTHAPSVPIEVTMEAVVFFGEDGRAYVQGKTNLPDGTDLSIFIVNEDLGRYYPGEAIVKGRAFRSDSFGGEDGIETGNYTVEITTGSILIRQPDFVRKIIGEAGEFMIGPLVKKDTFDEYNVEFSFPFLMGDQQEADAYEKAFLEKVEDIKSRIRDLIAEGRAMQDLRDHDMPACIQKMRIHQPTAKALRIDAKKFENFFGLHAATMQADFCITCSDTAIDACDRAEKDLREFENPPPLY